jgi:Concanavalin A-like lectin/glucanases superfamily/Bacterial Ig-like domain (group 3)
VLKPDSDRGVTTLRLRKRSHVRGLQHETTLVTLSGARCGIAKRNEFSARRSVAERNGQLAIDYEYEGFEIPLADGQWHHVFLYDFMTRTIPYVDGRMAFHASPYGQPVTELLVGGTTGVGIDEVSVSYYQNPMGVWAVGVNGSACGPKVASSYGQEILNAQPLEYFSFDDVTLPFYEDLANCQHQPKRAGDQVVAGVLGTSGINPADWAVATQWRQSVELTFRTTSTTGWTILQSGLSYRVRVNPAGVLELWSPYTTEWVTTTGPAVNTGSWHHLVLTLDNAGIVHLFQDGVETGSAARSYDYYQLRIGNGPAGDVDEVALYQRLLSSAEIARRAAGLRLAKTRTSLTPAGPWARDVPIEFTASVALVTPGPVAPVGSVRFFDGAALLGVTALDANGVATKSVTLAPGEREVWAEFVPSNTVAGSISLRLRDLTDRLQPTIRLENRPGVGWMIKVEGRTGFPDVPSGFVSVSIDAVYSGSVALDASGESVLPVPLQPGRRFVELDYGGDPTFKAASIISEPLVYSVSLEGPTRWNSGTPVTFIATVLSGGVLVPGTVELREAGTVLASGVVGSNGSVTLRPTLSSGDHTLVAYFQPTTGDPVQSAPLSGTAETLEPSLLSVNPASVSALEGTSFQVAGIATYAGDLVATGNVRLSIDGREIGGSDTDATGVATVSASFDRPGSYVGILSFESDGTVNLAESITPVLITITPRYRVDLNVPVFDLYEDVTISAQVTDLVTGLPAVGSVDFVNVQYGVVLDQVGGASFTRSFSEFDFVILARFRDASSDRYYVSSVVVRTLRYRTQLTVSEPLTVNGLTSWTVTASNDSGSLTPTGVVTAKVNDTVIATGTLNGSGSVAMSATVLPGTTIDLTYEGSSRHKPSTAQKYVKRATEIVMDGPTKWVVGYNSATFTVTDTDGNPASGYVRVIINGIVQGLWPLDPTGVANTYPYTDARTFLIEAEYEGPDATSNVSATITAKWASSISADVTGRQPNGATDITVTVQDPVTGTVQAWVGQTLLATKPFIAGAANFVVNRPTGTTIEFRYVETIDTYGSTVAVVVPTTTIAMSIDGPDRWSAQEYNLVTVSAVNDLGMPVDFGAINLWIDGQDVGGALVANGEAEINAYISTIGGHRLVARFVAGSFESDSDPVLIAAKWRPTISPRVIERRTDGTVKYRVAVDLRWVSDDAVGTVEAWVGGNLIATDVLQGEAAEFSLNQPNGAVVEFRYTGNTTSHPVTSSVIVPGSIRLTIGGPDAWLASETNDVTVTAIDDSGDLVSGGSIGLFSDGQYVGGSSVSNGEAIFNAYLATSGSQVLVARFVDGQFESESDPLTITAKWPSTIRTQVTERLADGTLRVRVLVDGREVQAEGTVQVWAGNTMVTSGVLASGSTVVDIVGPVGSELELRYLGNAVTARSSLTFPIPAGARPFINSPYLVAGEPGYVYVYVDDAAGLRLTSGTVELFDGLNSVGSSNITQDGYAVIRPTLSLGSHTLRALFTFGNGDTYLSEPVVAVAKYRSVMSSTATVRGVGSLVSWTTTVMNSDRTVPASGEVQVLLDINGTAVASGTLDANGSVLLSVGAPPGTQLWLRYLGSETYLEQYDWLQVRNDTAITLTAPALWFVGESNPGFVVSVTTPTAGVTPNGQVELLESGVVIATGTLNSAGSATFARTLTAGAQTLSARFIGSDSFASSTTESVTQVAKYRASLSIQNVTSSGTSLNWYTTASTTQPGTNIATGISSKVGTRDATTYLELSRFRSYGNFPVGVVTATTTFAGTAEIHPASVTFTRTLTRAVPSMFATFPAPVTVGAVQSASIYVYGTDTGLPVTVNITRPGFPAAQLFTSSSYAFQVPIDTSTAATQTWTIEFIGNADYLPRTITATLTFNQVTVSTSTSVVTERAVINQPIQLRTYVSLSNNDRNGSVRFLRDGVAIGDAVIGPDGHADFVDTVTEDRSYQWRAEYLGTIAPGLIPTILQYPTNRTVAGTVSFENFRVVDGPIVEAGSRVQYRFALRTNRGVLINKPASMFGLTGGGAGVAPSWDTNTVIINSLGSLPATYGITFEGDIAHAAATGTVTVQPAEIPLLNVSASQSSFGIGYMALRAEATGTNGPVNGSVEFSVEGRVVGTRTFAAGVASMIIYVTPGVRSVSARYVGNSSYRAAVATSAPVTVQGFVTVATTLETVQSIRGVPTVATAVVSPTLLPNFTHYPVVVPTGDVQFKINGAVVATVPVDGAGRATAAIEGLALGNFQVTASFVGDSIYAAATSPAATASVVVPYGLVISRTPATGPWPLPVEFAVTSLRPTTGATATWGFW